MSNLPLGLAVSVFLLSAKLCLAVPTAIFIESPDHPAAFFQRTGHKLFQELTWNSAKQEAELYVAYSDEPEVRERDVLAYDSFKVTFPNVHLDIATRNIYIEGAHQSRLDIGLLSGPFGSKVRLNADVQAVTWISNSVLHGALESTSR